MFNSIPEMADTLRVDVAILDKAWDEWCGVGGKHNGSSVSFRQWVELALGLVLPEGPPLDCDEGEYCCAWGDYMAGDWYGNDFMSEWGFGAEIGTECHEHKETVPYSCGDTLSHPQFGDGVVFRVFRDRPGTGEAMRWCIGVNFEGGGGKIIWLPAN